MVDEEGFSPVEMARLMSEKVGGDSNLTGTSTLESSAAGHTLSSQPVEQTLPRLPSILKRQNSSASAVQFDIHSISDDEAEENEDPFQTHGRSTQVGIGVNTQSQEFAIFVDGQFGVAGVVTAVSIA
jgi:hypothetical protein